jgi:hypothetical protein
MRVGERASGVRGGGGSTGELEHFLDGGVGLLDLVYGAEGDRGDRALNDMGAHAQGFVGVASAEAGVTEGAAEAAEEAVIKVAVACAVESVDGLLPALEEVGLGEGLSLHGDFVQAFAADDQARPQPGHVPDQAVHPFGRGHPVDDCIMEVVGDKGHVDEHGLETELADGFEDVASEDGPPEGETGVDFDHDLFVTILGEAGVGLGDTEAAALMPTPAAEILPVDTPVLEIAHEGMGGVAGVHIDGVEVGHDAEAHGLGLGDELFPGRAGDVARVVLVVGIGAPVGEMNEDAMRLEAAGEGVKDLR